MNANVNIAQRTQRTALETEAPSSFSTEHINSNHDQEKFAFSFAKKFDNAIPPISFISPPLLNQKQNEYNFALRQSQRLTIVDKITTPPPPPPPLPSQRHPLPPLILHKKGSKAKSIDSESSSSANTTTEMSSSESSLSSFGLAMNKNNSNLLNDNHPIKRVKSSASSASSRSASSAMSHSSSHSSLNKQTTNKSHSQTQQNVPVVEKFDRNEQNISIAIYDDNDSYNDDDYEKPKTTSSHSIDSVRLDELKSTSSEQQQQKHEEHQRCTKSGDSSDYERIKENLNDFSRRVDFKMKGLLADDETRNQINDWLCERGTNVVPPVNAQYISSNKKNKTTNNTNSNSQSYYRTFNDWRSHLIFYKQTKGYHRNTPEEMSFRNLKNSTKETRSNEKSTITSTNPNDGEQSQQQQQQGNKQHYPLAILNTNFSMGNKHLLTNDHYIDQLKQIQTRILQPDAGANLLPEVKKLGPFNKNTSNSESDLGLIGPNNLHHKKPLLAKLYGITVANNNNNNNLNKDDLSLQVVNAFPKKIQPENNKQQSCNDLTAASMEKMTSGSFTNTPANTSGSEKIVPQMQPALNGTLIHLKNRASTPHKTITNIGFKMEHKPLSSESNNQKTIPYTKGMEIFFRLYFSL